MCEFILKLKKERGTPCGKGRKDVLGRLERGKGRGELVLAPRASPYLLALLAIAVSVCVCRCSGFSWEGPRDTCTRSEGPALIIAKLIFFCQTLGAIKRKKWAPEVYYNCQWVVHELISSKLALAGCWGPWRRRGWYRCTRRAISCRLHSLVFSPVASRRICRVVLGCCQLDMYCFQHGSSAPALHVCMYCQIIFLVFDWGRGRKKEGKKREKREKREKKKMPKKKRRNRKQSKPELLSKCLWNAVSGVNMGV